jgi:hypothetical protein
MISKDGKKLTGSQVHKGLRRVSDVDRDCYAAHATGEYCTTIAKRIGRSPEWVRHAVERVVLERAIANAEGHG